MRLNRIIIENFRCLEGVSIDIDDVTVLIGPNGSGKSTLLRAIEWFFEGYALEGEDVFCADIDKQVSVTGSFTNLSKADRVALGEFVIDDVATFSRKSILGETGSESELTGRRLSYPPFEEVRRFTTKTEIKNAYSALRRDKAQLGLPSVQSADTALTEMQTWEHLHPGDLEEVQSNARALLLGSFADRFDFLFVAAVVDAGEEVQDSSGSLLERLLSRLIVDQEQLATEISEIERETTSKVQALMTEVHAANVESLSDRLSARLRALVPEGLVSLKISTPNIKVHSRPSFAMTVADGGIATNVTRQGHGFQRALLLAALQEIASADHIADDPPGLLIGIEEPELYQHPGQARHLAAVLARLAEDPSRNTQVAFATHSPYFVDPRRFDQMRRFGRRQVDDRPRISVRSATFDLVAARLNGVYTVSEIPQKIGLSLKTGLSEAVFAPAVLLVEGSTDAAVLRGFAERLGISMDAKGVAVIPVSGKNELPLALAVLEELHIPVFVVFDGDKRLPQRLPKDADVEATMKEHERWNRVLLQMLGGPDDTSWPHTALHERFAVFDDRLETHLEEVSPGFGLLVQKAREGGAGKPDAYFEATARSQHKIPELVEEILKAATNLV